MDKAPIKHNPYLHDLIWKLLQTHPPGRVLDIPSGPGYFARQAQEHGFECIAAEINQSLHAFPEVTYQKVDMAQTLPFADKNFDFIVSIEGIEHIENQALFMRECARIVKPGGKLFLTTPNPSSLENRLTFFLTGIHETPAKPIRDDLSNAFMEHSNLIPFHRLETFLRFAGFKIRTLTTYRLRKGSLFLYPFIYPFAFLIYLVTFNNYFKTKPDAKHYKNIYRKYLSSNILCGSHIVLVAEKQ